jgi:hypothetical protein
MQGSVAACLCLPPQHFKKLSRRSGRYHSRFCIEWRPRLRSNHLPSLTLSSVDPVSPAPATQFIPCGEGTRWGSFGCTGDGRATVAFDPALITSSCVYATAIVMRSLDEALAQADQPPCKGGLRRRHPIIWQPKQKSAREQGLCVRRR